MKLFQHKAIGGAIKVTNGPRFLDREGGGHVVNRDLEVAATFDTSESGRFAYRVFCLGLTSGPFAGSSLFDEDSGLFIVGDAGELAA